MGSSPFTATTPPSVGPLHRLSPSQRLLDALRSYLRRLPACGTSPTRILIAFSGGPDSTCLLWGLQQLAAERRLELVAAHLDHRLDPGSSTRAAQARALAERLGATFHGACLDVPLRRGTSLEGHAREQRYRFLEQLADRLDCAWIATAHHLDDQAETVLLRLLFGSGIEGLAAIQPRLRRRIRPLLTVRRHLLQDVLQEIPLAAVDDPTNRHWDRPRNRIRHHILPRWQQTNPTLVDDLGRLATTTGRARQRVDAVLSDHLRPRPLPLSEGIAIDRQAVQALPDVLFPFALAFLGRRSRLPYPVPAEARHEIRRQLQRQDTVGCDCGHGWRLEADSRRMWMRRREPSTGEFAYTLTVPGVIEIPDLGLRVHVGREDVTPSMFQGRPDKAAISGRLPAGQSVIIRNRRPGDRIRPLGSTRSRRLNDLLIDRHVPRPWRDRLPLLVINGNIAWVPGVTIGDDFRLRQDPTAWVLSIERQSSLTQESVDVRATADDGSKERSNP